MLNPTSHSSTTKLCKLAANLKPIQSHNGTEMATLYNIRDSGPETPPQV